MGILDWRKFGYLKRSSQFLEKKNSGMGQDLMSTKRVTVLVFVYRLKHGRHGTVVLTRVLPFWKVKVECINKVFVFETLYCNFVKYEEDFVDSLSDLLVCFQTR